MTPEERRKQLDGLHQQKLKLAEIKAEAKKETELPRQVELNMQAKQIEHGICKIHNKL